MDQTAAILRTRESQGLQIALYVHLGALALMAVLSGTVSQSAFETWSSIAIAFGVAAILALFILPVRREKALLPAGLVIVVVDSIVIFILPFIWLKATGSDSVPRSYLVKTVTLPLMTSLFLMLTALPMRPFLIAAATVASTTVHSLLLLLAVTDPRSKFGVSWVGTVLGDELNVPLYFNIIFMIVLGGVFLFVMAVRFRRTVMQTIHAERLNSRIGRYFSPGVRAEMKAAGEEFFLPGGRVQEVVVLFSDIRGFTTMSESLGADRVLAFLSAYQKVMLEIIFRHGGTLDKFIGDGILAVFGTPHPAPDDADRAVRCALDMRDALESLNQERASAGEEPIRIGIGLHAGPAIVGNVGSEERLEYTVIGNTVNTASRVESATKKFGETILITSDVLDRMKLSTAARPLGRVKLRGKNEPVGLYSVS